MGIGPVFAVPRLLERNGLTVDDVDLWELWDAIDCPVECILIDINQSLHRTDESDNVFLIDDPVMVHVGDVPHAQRQLARHTQPIRLSLDSKHQIKSFDPKI